MRFATYAHHDEVRTGVVDGEEIAPLPAGTRLLDLLGDGLPALLEAGASASPTQRVALSEVRLLPPFQPPTVRDFVAFEEHVEGVRRTVSSEAGVPEAWYDIPTFYFTNPYAVIGAHDDVPVPPGSRVLDLELEVAAVIGREGRDLSPEQARDHIVGYTIFNDWSARDLQAHEMQIGLGPAKGKDTATTLGPWLVTADEVEDHRDAEGFLSLALTAEINGRVIGQDLLSNMGWPFEDLVAYASRGTVVRPGDVLGSGTCGNGGCLGELWGRGASRDELPPLVPGDVVTLTVEGLGSVSNRVVPGVDPVTVPRARPRPRTRPGAATTTAGAAR